jgi:uncharacterized protein YggE
MRHLNRFATASALAVVSWCTGPAAGQAPERGERRQPFDSIPKLTVRGQAELNKPADQLRLQVGVVTEAPQAESALGDNSRKMQSVVEALKKAGLGAGEYETGSFSLQPVYSQRPRSAEAEWQPKIVGYRVSNTLNVKTKKLDMAGKLIQAANDAGANSIDSISFDLADPRTHRAEAIAAAAANARSDAGALSQAADVKLVRILGISLDEAGYQPPIPLMQAGRMAMAETAMAPPIEPGEIVVRAGVTIVYEIAPQVAAP